MQISGLSGQLRKLPGHALYLFYYHGTMIINFLYNKEQVAYLIS